MKKRFFVCALAAVMALATFTACGKGGEEEPVDPDAPIGEKVTIDFWGWGDLAEQNNYRTLVNQFMNEPGNENITVNYVGNTAEAHMQKLENTSKKNLPALFMLSDYDFYGYAADGMLKDITSYVSEEELSTIWPQAVAEYYFNEDTMLLGKTEGAKLYGLPKDLGPFTLVYNRTLIDAQAQKNGVSQEKVEEMLNPTDPMTWTEFRNFLKDLVPGLANGQVGITHYEIEAAIYSNNANFFTEDAATSRITEKNFTDALQFCADLALVDGVMTPESQQDVDGYTRFQGGNALFSFMGPWDAASFWSYNLPFTWDVAPVPYNGENPDAVSTAWVGSMGYCVGVNTSAAKTAAAIRLAKYLALNENAQRKFYELGQQVPNIVSMATDEYLNDTQGLIGDKMPANRSVWVDTINGTSETDRVGGKVRPRYYTYSSGWYGEFTAYLSDEGLWSGRKTAAEICANYNNIFQGKLNTMRNELGLS